MKGKQIRNRGKTRFSDYFKKFSDGDKVALVRELGFACSFPKRIIGNTGEVIGTRGSYKIVKVLDGDKIKTFIIHPIHLKKLKPSPAKTAKGKNTKK